MRLKQSQLGSPVTTFIVILFKERLNKSWLGCGRWVFGCQKHLPDSTITVSECRFPTYPELGTGRRVSFLNSLIHIRKAHNLLLMNKAHNF